jgi:hypothetical protein
MMQVTICRIASFALERHAPKVVAASNIALAAPYHHSFRHGDVMVGAMTDQRRFEAT